MIKELVLFGVTGDLAKQKLVPALFNLYRNGKVSKKSSFVGFGRKKFTKVNFQNFIEELILKYVEESSLQDVEMSSVRDYASQWSYIESELDSPGGYTKLNELSANAVIYLSLPPMYQYGVVQMLVSSGVLSKSNQRKIAIEKPFGFDSVSSQKLESLLIRKLKRNQILRVDHYAGKQALVELEQVAHQGIFRDMLHVKNFKKIEVNCFESKDVSMRGSFYDAVGALNDVGQNHVLHMLATILALPEASTHDLVNKRAESLSLLSIKTGEKSPILAQYEGFNTTPGVKPDSTTETFFKVFAEIKKRNNAKGGTPSNVKMRQMLTQRWGGVQIELTGGKALAKSDASIVLYPTARNAQPIRIMVNGYGTQDAYEQIFLDALYYYEDRFMSFEQIQVGWEIVEKIKKLAKAKKIPKVKSKNLKNGSVVTISTYKRGSYPQDISHKS